MPEQTALPQTQSVTRVTDFHSRYANNFQLEQTLFDLKLIFGQVSQFGGQLHVEQNTSVTIPWIQAKLLVYFLQINVAGFELQNGKIKIPDELVPIPIGPVPAEQENNPKMQELYKLLNSMRDQFVSSL